MYAIRSYYGRGAGIEIVRHLLGGENRHRMRPQMRVERVAHGVSIPVPAEIDMGDLAARVHAGIGAAGALHCCCFAGERRDGRHQHALHCQLVGLHLPAGKGRAVIRITSYNVCYTKLLRLIINQLVLHPCNRMRDLTVALMV